MNFISASAIRSLMTQHNNPFYLYDKSIIQNQMRVLKENFPQFDFLYSVKTNPFAPIVKTILTGGIGADAASAAEVEKAAAGGAVAKDIYFSAPGKTKADLESAFGKCTIIADSYGELELLNRISAARKESLSVGVRLNPDFTMDGDKGVSGKFGIDTETLPLQAAFLSGLTNLKIVGIHLHLRSQVLDDALLCRYYDRIFQLALHCKEALGWALEFINFGGGLGVVYSLENDKPLNVQRLGTESAKLLASYKDRLGVRFIIESGRFLVCASGRYVTPVVDVKESRGTKYVLVANGLNGFIRPAIAAMVTAASPNPPSVEPLFTVKDAFAISINGKEGNEEKVNLVGNLCTAADVVANGIMLPKAEVGDAVVITNAGSYAYSLSPLLFSSHPLPLQILMDSDGNVEM